MTDPTPAHLADPAPAAAAASKQADTRLVLVSPKGEYVKDDHNRIMGIVLTGLPNGITAAPIALEVEQQCDMGHWHTVGRTSLPAYDGVWPAETAS